MLHLSLAQRWQLEKMQFKSVWFISLLVAQVFMFLLSGVQLAFVARELIKQQQTAGVALSQVYDGIATQIEALSFSGVILFLFSLEQARYWVVGTYRRWLCDGVSRADLILQMLFSLLIRVGIGLFLVALLLLGIGLMTDLGTVLGSLGYVNPRVAGAALAEIICYGALHLAFISYLPRYFTPLLIWFATRIESITGFVFPDAKWTDYLPLQLFDGMRRVATYSNWQVAELLLLTVVFMFLWLKRTVEVEL